MDSVLSIPLIFLVLCFSLSISSTRMIEEQGKEAILEPDQPLGKFVRPSGFNPIQVIQLSSHPRVFLYEGFLSEEECDHLITLGRDKLEKSMAVDQVSRNNTMIKVPTDSVMSLSKGQDEIVSRIEERIALWTLLPKENGEDIQILHYTAEQRDQPYNEYYNDTANLGLGGQRVATVMMYLSDVKQGGETIFLKSELQSFQRKDETWSECASKRIAVKPIKGNALLFFNLHPNTTLDESSFQGDCPALAGEKWSATKWIHVSSIESRKRKRSPPSDDPECTDEEDSCVSWAAMGECQKNPVYMLGTPDYYGSCRKSCNAC
ncbi:hypothetical protein QJS10_CPA10g00401 [Acorus calamus]|uniref:procollagen-proline 4-dioxygenase n=1 Tax=Acorus calamus TaxID=4465 RepID=A0AAV9DYM0_ACOCL|nr:hypothetical protein QJS10_CPA10g00401 [Acorus calamus]